MPSPMPMDHGSVASLQAEMLEACRAVAERHGLSLSAAGYNFTASSAKVGFELAQLSEGGEVLTRERQWFKQCAGQYGLDPGMLDREFVSEGKTYTVVGMNPRARRNPVVARSADGRQWRFNAAVVRDAFAAAAASKAAA